MYTFKLLDFYEAFGELGIMVAALKNRFIVFFTQLIAAGGSFGMNSLWLQGSNRILSKTYGEVDLWKRSITITLQRVSRFLVVFRHFAVFLCICLSAGIRGCFFDQFKKFKEVVV